jgi:1-acyl-sn-glycerol-3-phosphate acyltransferase
VRLFTPIWCRNLVINNRQWLQANGPILIAANHPNSFLDAIILCAIFKKPIYSLARGDAFKNNFLAKILQSLKMLPVYRVSEGVENLEENYKTFEACLNIFKKNGIVLIFSEGRCINEWALRPLKKGTARLAFSAWEQNIPLQVLPLGINYDSFKSFGKKINLKFGQIISKQNFENLHDKTFGNKVQAFNDNLKSQLTQLVFQVKPYDKNIINSLFPYHITNFKKIILALPTVVGFLLHFPLYAFTKKITHKYFWHNDHYDSVWVSLLFLLYPFYLLILFFIIGFSLNFTLAGYIILFMPISAYCFMQLKNS